MDINRINRLRAWMALAAEALDSYRIVPRVFLITYVWFCYKVGIWFMSLPDPTTQHTFFISTVVGAMAAIIGLYQKSGKDWGSQGFRIWPFKDPVKTVNTLLEESTESDK